MERDFDIAPAAPDQDDIIATFASVLTGRYGAEARAVVELQIAAADQEWRRSWLAIQAALPGA
jgi:hypothetical protein